LDPLIKSHLADIDSARLFSRLLRKARVAHQKVTADFPTAELTQIGADEGNRTIVVSLEELTFSMPKTGFLAPNTQR
jgi:hypothetical protein